MSLVFGLRERHAVVDALLRDLDAAGPAVDRSIHADDEMLLFGLATYEGDWDAALAVYYRDGLAVAAAVRQILRWQAARAPGALRLLDFASGYGRVTRFLTRELPRERLWVSDIHADAVEFQIHTFGVRGLVSTAEPEAFACDERFDLVFVTSLFTHLPEPTFHGWLARLVALLAPRGLLAFSVHDESLLSAAQTMPRAGFYFEARSESRSLDPGAYGSTWVTEGFVRAAVEHSAPGAACVRLPRALGDFQDLYLVSLDPEADFASLGFDPGPVGFLDDCAIEAGALTLRGWAAHRVAPGRVAAVRILVDGRVVAERREFDPRPDVPRGFSGASPESGFTLRVPLPERSRHGVVSLVVEAETMDGVRGALFAGTVAQALLMAARGALASSRREAALRARHLELAAEALNARIAAMESSRFWKLRTRWFRLKRALGLTTET